MGKSKQLSSDEQRERAEARRLANGIADGGGGGVNPGNFTGTCNKCGKAGHRQADCPGASTGGKGGKGDASAAEAAAKTGKGHKQRGSGAVLKSSGPVETRSGVLKKDWQRLPTQLLLEWTQREKRPEPHYYRARASGGKGGKGGKGKRAEAAEEEDPADWRKYLAAPEPQEEQTEFRQRVVLADAKHDDRSLAFCPAQSSATEPLAKEHAALLALLQVCGNLPLDRKLPDEFRDVWLASIAAPAAAKAAKTAATSALTAAQAVALASAPASEDSTNSSSSSSSSSSNNSSSSSAPAAITLSVDRKFASKAEERVAEAERVAFLAGLARRKEALAKANADAPVLLSAKMVAFLERCLGLGAPTTGSSAFHKQLLDSNRGGNGGKSEDAAAAQATLSVMLSGKARFAAEACVAAGFSAEAAAMAAVQASAEVDEDEEDEEADAVEMAEAVASGEASAVQRLASRRSSALAAASLAWLALHVAEEDLPTDFGGSQKAPALPQFLKPATKAAAAPTAPLSTPVPLAGAVPPASTTSHGSGSGPDSRAVYPGAGCYGFSVADFEIARAGTAPRASAAGSGAGPAEPAGATAADAAAWVGLGNALAAWTTTPFPPQAGDGDGDDKAAEAAAEALATELMVAESMFADDAAVLAVGGGWGHCLSVVGLADQGRVTVDFWLPVPTAAPNARRAYPARSGAPCALVRGGSVACQAALAQHAAAAVAAAAGDADALPAVVVDLLAWVHERAWVDGGDTWQVEPPAAVAARAALFGRAGSVFADRPSPDGPATSTTEEKEGEEPRAVADSEISSAFDSAATARGKAPVAATTSAAGNSATSSAGQGGSKGGSNGGKGGGRRFGGFWDTPPPVAGKACKGVPEPPLRLQQERSALPAFKARSQVLQQLSDNRVVLVSGGTGCGKTTQVPQFILEEARAAGRPCKVVVCQPRRLAAVGVATRVHDELGELNGQIGLGANGSRVGYMVRGDAKCCAASCQLLFCTTGVLLQRLRSDPVLSNVTHLIVDEVHERHLDADFLLAALKVVLPQRPTLTVVMMSATLDAQKFSAYFSHSGGSLDGHTGGSGGVKNGNMETVALLCPVVSIPGMTHPVQDFYLDDVAALTGYLPRNLAIERARQAATDQSDEAFKGAAAGFPRDDDGDAEEGDDDDEENGGGGGGSSGMASGARYGEASKQAKAGRLLGGSVDVGCALDYKLIVMLVRAVVSRSLQGSGGSLLIFMPGVGEIARLCSDLSRPTDDVSASLAPLHVLALHGALPASEQSRVFGPPPKGSVKVIVATNVAETSITIPDCTVVIDTARAKQTGFDGDRGAGFLAETWAAQDAMQQRRGRAGRVRPGVCFRLVTKRLYQSLPLHTPPEISRSPLDSLVLMVKANGYGNPQSFLSTFLDPPPAASVRAAVNSLRAINALAPAPSTSVAQAGGKGQRPGSGGSLELTALGGHLASLPCGPRLGKLLVLGAVLGVADLSVTVAACLSTRSPLLSPSQLEKGRASALEVRAARAELLVTSRCGHQRSDHGFWAALVDCYRAAAPRSRRDCCDALGVSAVRMAELVALRRQLGDAVRSLGFDVPSDALPPRLETQPLAAAPVCPAVPRSLEEWRLLSAALCGALWPNAAKVRRPVQKYHSTSGGAVEADPDAKELKFQIQVPSAGNASGGNGSSSGSGNSDGGGQGGATAAGWCEERVWVHPASVVFAQRKFPSPWLVFSDLVTTSRPFLRDASEVSPYALLLFGGPLAVDVAKGTVAVLTPATIDAQQLAHLAADSPGWSSGAAWCRFSASPKVAALAGALRAALDALLDRKFKDPSMEVADDPVAAALVRLLVTQGMG